MTWLAYEDAARIPLTEDAVLELLRQHFGELDAVCISPHVPETKELAARRAHAAHLPPRERILALYEARRPASFLDTVVHDGFVVTTRRVCWKNVNEAACAIEWEDLDPEEVALDGDALLLGEDAAIVVAEPEVQDACANAFHVLALSGMRPAGRTSGCAPKRDTVPDTTLPDYEENEESGLVHRYRPSVDGDDAWTTMPPRTDSSFDYFSHAQSLRPDHACWHCLTPLYETTPQCAFCGATPKKAGWLRTG